MMIGYKMWMQIKNFGMCGSIKTEGVCGEISKY